VAVALLGAASSPAAEPTITLESLPLRSSDAVPSFSGAAGGAGAVEVEVFRGTSTAGEHVLTLTAHPSGGRWVSADVYPPLQEGTYAAVAWQQPDEGGEVERSNAITFEVDAKAPTVSLTAPRSPSSDRTPSFSGTASETTPVTVLIYRGASTEGELVAAAETTLTGSVWRSLAPTPALEGGDHTFTAVAKQASAVEHEVGESAPVTFVVDTEAPRLTLSAPPAISNDATPAFAGSTSEDGQVSVQIFAGGVADGTPVASVTVPASGGSWSSGALSTPLADGTYTALATEASTIGNPTGASVPVTFAVDTAPPVVTLSAPLSPSANRQPSFSGIASDRTPVTITIYRGAGAGGIAVEALTADVGRSGAWESGRAAELPGWGQYTAVASQPSALGNPKGESAPVTFAVEPIAPRVATEGATAVTRSSAALYASVDPRGAGVGECRFEYGPTTAYGRSVACGFVSGGSAFPTAAAIAVHVFVRIYGLVPASTYHFRIAAVGEGGTATGEDQTFTTLPPWLFEDRQPSTAQTSGGPADTAAAHIALQLASARHARISRLLAAGTYAQRISVPSAGTVALAWYYTPAGSIAHSARVRVPVLLAGGKAVFAAAGTARVTLRLTAAGRERMRTVKHLRVNAVCVFVPRRGTQMRVSVTFELAR
jgi:Bacterial Ig-like domain